MSPLSHLLVYWVRDDGEVAAASHLIHLDKCFPNKVKVAFLKQQALPGEEVPLRVAAAPHSLCAVTAVDDSTSYLSSYNHNPSLLDSRLIFQQLGRFQVDRSDRPRQVDDYEYCSRKQEQDAEEELEPPDWDLRRRRRRSLVGIPTATYADSLQAFEDFGAVVISDLTLETRPCLSDPHGAISGFDRSMGYIPWGGIADKITVGSNPMNAASPLAYPLTYGNSIRATVPLDTAHQSLLQSRTFFPETWLWELVHVGAEGSAVLHRQLPHTITDWVASTFCISPHAGLGVSTLTKVRAFQPFFLDFNAPYSVKSSEMVQLKVSLFNYLPHGLPVRLGLEQSAGVSLVSGQGSVVSCVQERTSWVHTFHIRPTWLGEVNITVTAVVDPDYAGPCGPDPLPLASDTIVKPVLVKPEGFLVQKTKSALFCPADFFNDTTATWQLDVPADVVPNSASATVSVVADIMGPTLENLDNLVQLPKGCGEQNMVRFTPNIHVINYMNATNQHNTVVCSEAVSNLQKGYQRQLNYRHKDGSYSAFGSSDSTGSMWLTAFVLKSFAQARRHTLLDEEDLQRTAKWITTKQLENGCFPVVGQVIHKDMRGGLTTETSSAALTAYVMSALLEAEVPLNPAVTSNAAFCLRGDREPNVYTLALTTNAFSLLGMRQLAEESLGHLLAVANADSDLLWWEAGANSLALDIETTAYALLSLVELGGETNMIHALKVVRWLSKHRNAEGGFVSTQDTVMALEALTKYAMAIPTHDTNLDVLITALDFQHRFQVRQHDRLLLKQQRIPLLPTQLHVLADGRGCAFVQAKLRYNVPMKSGHEAFELAVFTGPVASVDECTMQRLEVCVSYKPAGHSNMVVLEVGMVTGFYPDRDSLYELAQDTQLDLKRWEEQEDQVNFYFEHMTSRRQCVGFQVVRELVVDNPAQATVVVYDYYQSEMVASTTYTMQVGCKSEKLPNPQPDVDWLVLRTSANSTTNETTTGDTGLTAMQADSGNLTTSGGNSTPTGLNPQFVDVDHELATPQGQEGPQPVYVSPAGYMAAEEERSSCPRCAQLDSRVFTSTYCSSGAAYKLLVRAGHAAKVLLAMSPRRPLFRQRRQLSIRLPAGCSCPPLDAEGEHVLLLSPRPLPGASVQLGAAHTVLSLPAGSGRPEVIRAARRTCPA